MNEPADAGNYQQHDQRELVELQREAGAEAAGLDPGEIGLQPGNSIGAERQELARYFQGGQKSEAGAAQRDGVDGAARPAGPKNPIGGRAQQGQQRNDPQALEYQHSDLELQQIDAFHVERLAIPRDHDDNGQADRRFRSGHHNHKKYEDLPLQLSQSPPKRDEGKIHGVEHQLDGHKNGDDVALENEPDHAEAKEHGTESKVIRNGDQ